MPESWIAELNDAQRAAATAGDGPVLVIAGAGSGKTRTLACRVAHLVERGVPPERILLLTFTRRAAAEMLSRAGRMVGPGATGKVWGGTFHSVANRLLRTYGRGVGVSPDFTVMDPGDSADMMDLIRNELARGEGRRRFPRKNTLAAIYSRVVNSRARLKEILAKHYPWCVDELEGIREIFEGYTRRKQERQVFDYDDLLLYWLALFQDPQVGLAAARRFEHILVDEYQDTNRIQAEILRAMRSGPSDVPRNLMVVGDDAQSIYSFRAATVRNILDFPQQFEGTRVITLDRNYRSTQPILDASNRVMSHAPERYTKDLFTQRTGGARPRLITCRDEEQQSDAVCARVLQRREEGTLLREQAVLFRAGHHSDHLEVELARRNIPFVKYGGLRFVEAAHVKDMMAFMRILENPADEMSWFRVLQLFEGIGPAAARRICGALSEGEAGPSGALEALRGRPPAVPAAAREAFASFRTALLDCLELNKPAAEVERIRRFYEPIFRRTYDNAEVRLRDLDQLEQIAGGYTSRGSFINDLALDPPVSTSDLAADPLLDEDYLILSTIHSAKGCEWDAVHIIHAADGMIPSDMATKDDEEIAEERRLLYVAMTRARDELNLYFPLRYYHHPFGRSDRHSYAQLTRFIPPADLDLYERISVHEAPAEEQPEEATGIARAAVNDLLSGLWD